MENTAKAQENLAGAINSSYQEDEWDENISIDENFEDEKDLTISEQSNLTMKEQAEASNNCRLAKRSTTSARRRSPSLCASRWTGISRTCVALMALATPARPGTRWSMAISGASRPQGSATGRRSRAIACHARCRMRRRADPRTSSPSPAPASRHARLGVRIRC